MIGRIPNKTGKTQVKRHSSREKKSPAMIPLRTDRIKIKKKTKSVFKQCMKNYFASKKRSII